MSEYEVKWTVPDTIWRSYREWRNPGIGTWRVVGDTG